MHPYVGRAARDSSLITLYCPSRGRPKAAFELQDSFSATKGLPSTGLVFLVDRDDPTISDYPKEKFIYEPTGDPTGPLNLACLASDSQVVGFIGDDSRLETDGWDRMVQDALRTPGFCWGHDGHNTPWPSTAFISRGIVQALGYMALPTLHRGYFDAVWVNLAAATKSARIIPAMFRHVNLPPGHPEGPTSEVISEDEASFKAWKQNGFASDAQKVKKVLDLAHFFS